MECHLNYLKKNLIEIPVSKLLRVGLMLMSTMLLQPQAVASTNEDTIISSLNAARAAFGQGNLSSANDYAQKARALAGPEEALLELFILEQQIDFCLQTFDVDCSGKNIIEHTNKYKLITEKLSADGIDKYKWRLISNLEKTIQLYLLTKEFNDAGKLVEILEKIIQKSDAIGGQSYYIDANLTLARWYLKVNKTKDAELALNRAWVTFICFENVGDYFFIKYSPQFMALFNSLGSVTQASTIGYLVTPSFIRQGDANKIDSVKFGLVLGAVRGGEGKSGDAAFAYSYALENLNLIQFNARNKLRYEVELKGELIINCVIHVSPKCVDSQKYSLELESMLGSNLIDARTKFSLAMILSIYKLGVNEKINSEILNALTYKIKPEEWYQVGTVSFDAALKIKDFIYAVDKADKNLMISSIEEASVFELRRIINEVNQKPFEVQTLNSSQKILLTICSYLLASSGDLTEKQKQILFEVNEYQNKAARSLESQYLRNVAKLKGRINQSNLQAIHRLNQDINLLEKRLIGRAVESAGKSDDNKPVRLNVNALVRLNALYDERNKFTDFVNRIQDAENIEFSSLINLQKKLRDGERYINYQTLNGPSENLIISCVSKNEFWFARSSTENVRPTDLKILQSALSNPSPPSKSVDDFFPIEASLRISKAALYPIKDCLLNAKHLYFMQDESIAGLPHSVLIDPTSNGFNSISNNKRMSEVPWLGINYSIGVLNGAYHLIASREINYDHLSDGRFLGVGDPVLSGKTEDGVSRGKSILRGVNKSSVALSELEELPDTGVELLSSAKYYGPNSKLLVRENATEAAIRRLPLRPYDVISFATHGLVREELPGLVEPALVLTPSNASIEVNDGILTATDISRMDLNANLVILSACNSARFNLNLFAPEAASLSTAFFLAGSKATMATLWSINSNASSALMREFSKHFSKGNLSSSEALQLSMKSLLKEKKGSENYANPRYWASYVVYGDSSPRRKNNQEVKVADTLINVDQKFIEKSGNVQESMKSGNQLLLTGSKPNPASDRYKGYTFIRNFFTARDIEIEDAANFIRGFVSNGVMYSLTYPVAYETKNSFKINRIDSNGKTSLLFQFEREANEIPLKPLILNDNKVAFPTNVLVESGRIIKIHIVDMKLRTLITSKVITSVFSQRFDDLNFSVVAPGLINMSIVGVDSTKTMPNQISKHGLVQPCSGMKATELVYLDEQLLERKPRATFYNLMLHDSLLLDGQEIWSFSEINSCTALSIKHGLAVMNANGSLTPHFVNLGGYSGSRATLIKSIWGVVAVGMVTRRFDSSTTEDVKFDTNFNWDPINSSNNQSQTGVYVAQFDNKLKQYNSDVIFNGLDIFMESYLKLADDELMIFGSSGDRRFGARVHLVGDSHR